MIQLDQINKLVRLIQSSPTGDNCQPFNFKFIKSRNVLQIIYIKNLGEHILNPNEMASLISLGMIDYLISNSGMSIKDKQLFFQEINKDNEIVAEYIFEDNSFIDEKFFEVCLKRSTFREKFSKKVLELSPPKDIIFQKEVSQDFIKSMLSVEDIFWENIDILKDVFSWVNLSHRDHVLRRRGLYWKELGVNGFEWPFLALVKYTPRLAIKFYRIIGSRLIKRHINNIYSHSSFLFITVRNDLGFHQKFFELGSKAIQVWLELTKQKISAQPLSFYTFYKIHINDEMNDDFSNQLKLIVKEENVFIWIYRIGFGDKELVQKDETQRVELGKVLTII